MINPTTLTALTTLKMKRIQKLQSELKKNKLSAVLISKPQNVHYLSGFSGTNGRLLITPKKAVLITDFRYLRSASKQIPKKVAIYDQKDGLKKLMGRFKTLGIEDEHITHAHFLDYKKNLKGVRLKPISGLVERMRMIKEADEMKIIKKAVKITEKALEKFVRTIKAGQSEDEMEWNLLTIVRKLGGDKFSFSPIISFGKNTADVHHQKEKNNLKKSEKILIDFGIRYERYMTDITRVFFTVKPTDIEQKIYSTVLKANQVAIKAIKVGRKLSEVDKAARHIIESAGYGKYFGHATGHGVGLEVHEDPVVSEKSDITIEPGMLFTIEPGIYIDRTGGVRIEDMVYVNEKGKAEVLTKFSKKILVLRLS